MALGTSLTLSKDCATDVDTNTSVFDLRAADLDRGVYSKSGLTLPEELKLTVSHDTDKNGALRHLVRVDLTKVDANLVPATASVYTVAVRPQSTAITNAVMIEALNYLIDFLVEGGANANFVKVLNREV
jgi:hypothetical protein